MIIYTFSTKSSFDEIANALTQKDNKKRVKIGLNCSTTGYLNENMYLTSWHQEGKPEMDIQFNKIADNNKDVRNFIRVSFYWSGCSMNSNIVCRERTEPRIKLIRQLLKKYLDDFKEEPYFL